MEVAHTLISSNLREPFLEPSEEEERERATIDDTEQGFFLQEIAKFLVARGYFSEKNIGVLLNSLFNWWKEGEEDSYGGVFRRVFCEGDKLRADLYRELKRTQSHRERANMIARWFGPRSLNEFVERELQGIFRFLHGQNVPLGNLPSVANSAALPAVSTATTATTATTTSIASIAPTTPGASSVVPEMSTKIDAVLGNGQNELAPHRAA